MKSNYFLLLLILFSISCTEKNEENLTGYVYGTITSITGNAPVAGVIVQCSGVTNTTGSDGYYRIENIPIGNNQLIATKTDFETYSKTINVKSSGTEANISLVSNIVGASVWGYIKHSSGYPISGASVTIAGMTDNTDATGRYQLPSIPQGSQNIQVQISGYEEYNQSFYMYSSDKQININLRKFYNAEFSIDKDTYVGNWGSTSQGNETVLYTTYNSTDRYYLFFHSNINIPNEASVSEIKIELDASSNSLDVNWYVFNIREDWSEFNMSNANDPDCSGYFNASNIGVNGNKIFVDITSAYNYNSNNFTNYGFKMIPVKSSATNWSGMHIFSREYETTTKRPKLIISYLY